jgi:CRP-like cAMP-binding protein
MGCLCEQIAGDEHILSPVCIGHLWLFEHLARPELEALATAANRKTLSPREAVFHQGDPADSIVLIKSGRVKLSKVLNDGAEVTLDYRKAGDFLGENMFSEQADYPVTAWCVEPTLTCGFTRSKFESLVLQHPNLGLQVIKNLSRRIALLTDHVGSLAFSSLEQKLFGVLANVAREHGEKNDDGYAIPFPLTHEDLGFLVGAHRVSVTRAMKALRQSGKIAHRGQNLVLPSDVAFATDSF